MSIRSRLVQTEIIQFSGSDLTTSFVMKFLMFIGTLLMASVLALAQEGGGGEAGAGGGASMGVGGGVGSGFGGGRRK